MIHVIHIVGKSSTAPATGLIFFDIFADKPDRASIVTFNDADTNTLYQNWDQLTALARQAYDEMQEDVEARPDDRLLNPRNRVSLQQLHFLC